MNFTHLNTIKRLYFGYEALAQALSINRASARVCANRYAKAGILIRLKRNTYMLKERWNSLSDTDFFSLANILQTPSYVSLTTALSYYGITTQTQRGWVESIALKRTREFEAGNRTFVFTKFKKDLYFGFVKKEGFFVALPEKAFLDAVYLTALRRYRLDISAVDISKLDIGYLRKYLVKYPLSVQRIMDGFLKKT